MGLGEAIVLYVNYSLSVFWGFLGLGSWGLFRGPWALVLGRWNKQARRNCIASNNANGLFVFVARMQVSK